MTCNLIISVYDQDPLIPSPSSYVCSGTEPKFKYYIELRGQPGESRDEVSKRLDTMVNIILEELLHPSENGLITPSNL